MGWSVHVNEVVYHAAMCTEEFCCPGPIVDGQWTGPMRSSYYEANREADEHADAHSRIYSRYNDWIDEHGTTPPPEALTDPGKKA